MEVNKKRGFLKKKEERFYLILLVSSVRCNVDKKLSKRRKSTNNGHQSTKATSAMKRLTGWAKQRLWSDT